LSERIGEVEVQDGRVDSGQVSGTRRLVLLWVKSEAVHVDTISRGSGVVVLGLVVVEVRSFLEFKSVVAVELDVGALDRVSFAVKSETIVVRLSNANIFVDAVFGRFAGSEVSGEVFNRDGEISQAEFVADFDTFNLDGFLSTIGVGDNNSSVVDHIGQFNTVVVTQQREVDRAVESVVAPDRDTGFVDISQRFARGKTSDVVVLQFDNDSLAIIVSSVVLFRAQVSWLSVDVGAFALEVGRVDEDTTFSQVLGSVVNSFSGPGSIIVSVAQEFATASREG